MGGKQWLAFISASLFILLSYQNCGEAVHQRSDSASVSQQGFDGIFQSIITPECVACHSGVSPDGGVDLSSYDAIIHSGSVIPGDSQSSTLYLEVYSGAMPPNRPLSTEQIAAIGEWIDAGAQDSSGTAANEVPLVSAGDDLNLELPQANISVQGQASDPDGTISNLLWRQLSGPNTASLSGSNSLSLSVSGVVEGVYTFILEATDNEGAVSSDTVILTITEPINMLPVVDAGLDQSLQEPANSATLTGTANDPDGSIASIQWSQLSGPTANILSVSNLTTNVTGMNQAGTYEFQLMVTDNRGGAATDSVKVVINPAGNLLPSANAGADQTITLPTNSVTLNGSGTDPDGTVVAYQWTQVNGPSNATLSGAQSPTLTASNLVAGSYQFQLAVTDNQGGQGTDQVIVTVNAAPAAPTFTQLNQTIFGPRCLSCHTGNNPKGGYGMDNYNLVITAVVPGNSNASALYISVEDNSMPKGNNGGPLSTDEKKAVKDWIDAGALNN